MVDKKQYEKRFIEIGLRIAYFRKLRGMNQLQLAEKVGISRSEMSYIEAPGKPIAPSLSAIYKFSEVLGVKPSQLIEVEDEANG